MLDDPVKVALVVLILGDSELFDFLRTIVVVGLGDVDGFAIFRWPELSLLAIQTW